MERNSIHFTVMFPILYKEEAHHSRQPITEEIIQSYYHCQILGTLCLSATLQKILYVYIFNMFSIVSLNIFIHSLKKY
jgi:hypothetical protein